MKAYRIQVSSWTASFRYPNLISGLQPSLSVPPLSTIHGLICAAVGNYVSPQNISFGYVFKSEAQTMDLETIYQFNNKSSHLITKSNIIWRQILFDNLLLLYTTELQIAEAFKAPYFQLLLGRSNDLASVNSVEEVELQPLKELKELKGTVVPMKDDIDLAAPIQALPIAFTNEIPRRSIGARPFFLLEPEYDQSSPIHAKGFYDAQTKHEIYWHEI
ncbi:CRISPR-associated protein Cas5t [Candidatus Magnetomoraceae bacterium gMMP-15]